MTSAEKEAIIVSAEADINTAFATVGVAALPSWVDAIIKAIESILAGCGVAASVDRAQYPRLARLGVNTHLITHPHLLDGADGLSRAVAVATICEVSTGITVEKAKAFQKAAA